MITIVLGNVGSSKTLCTVKYMADNPESTFYSNIKTTLPNQIDLDGSMIVKKQVVGSKKKKGGEEQPIYEETLNIDFWKKAKKPLNVVIDEAHFIMNARTAMSKQNRIVNEWIALIRRVLASDSHHEGELILITQLHNRIDIIAREMATQIRYHVCHWTRECNNCKDSWSENSEMPEKTKRCYSCHSTDLKKTGLSAEVYHFRNMEGFQEWKYLGRRTYYRHYLLENLSRYFGLYNTLQWENLFSE